MKTQQIEFWSGDFGQDYTERNTLNQQSWNQQYIDKYGFSRSSMNGDFLSGMSKEMRILEVGCNTGQQLEALRRQGFNKTFGIELQLYAARHAKRRSKGIPVLQGSGFELPFKDDSFDLVFTSGVLIHIAPDHLPAIMNEIYRCSSRFIWGFEYYSDEVSEITYRGNAGVLWKANYASMFMNDYPDLNLVKKRLYPYISPSEGGNTDCMFLLEKQR